MPLDLHSACPRKDGTLVLRWADENPLKLTREEIGEYYGPYRLHVPEAERAMARSLERYGQLSPVVVCKRLDRYELIDGFKRLSAARGMPRMPHLSARLMEADESGRQRPPSIIGRRPLASGISILICFAWNASAGVAADTKGESRPIKRPVAGSAPVTLA